MEDVDDSRLGQLAWSTKLSSYSGSILFPIGSVELLLTPDGLAAEVTIELGRRIVDDFERHFAAARAALERDLLRLKNDVWLDDEESPVTASEFHSRVRLESISVVGSKTATFYFLDDDMFGGHSLLATTLDIAKGHWSAELYG